MKFEENLGKITSLVLDTSILIAYLTDEQISVISLLDEYIFNEES